MQEITMWLDLFTKYGITTIIAFLSIWGVVDLYLTLKKQWAPRFLGSFESIAQDMKGLGASVKELAAQSPKIDVILATVTEVKNFLRVGS